VAYDQRIHLRNVNLEDFEVVRVNVRGKPEIEQITAGLLPFAGLDVQCESPLALQRLSLCSGRFSPRRKMSCDPSVISRTVTSSTAGGSIRTGVAFVERSSAMLQTNMEPPNAAECPRKRRRFKKASIGGVRVPACSYLLDLGPIPAPVHSWVRGNEVGEVSHLTVAHIHSQLTFAPNLARNA
jgi:hypothetical protein